MRLLTTERRLVADGHDFSLTVCGLTRIYTRPVPVPVLFWLVLGFGRFASSPRACVCVFVCVQQKFHRPEAGRAHWWGEYGADSKAYTQGAIFQHNRQISIPVDGIHGGGSCCQCIVFRQEWIYWHGTRKVTLRQFRDNILMASNALPEECRDLVQLVKRVLEEAWVQWSAVFSADSNQNRQGECLEPVCRILGFGIVRAGAVKGMAHIQLASLKRLKHCHSSTLLHVHMEEGGDLGSLADTKRWMDLWSRQILLCLAWLQVMLLSGYRVQDAICAMHQAMQQALAACVERMRRT